MMDFIGQLYKGQGSKKGQNEVKLTLRVKGQYTLYIRVLTQKLNPTKTGY